MLLHLTRSDHEFLQTDILGTERESMREAGVMLSDGQINPQVKVGEMVMKIVLEMKIVKTVSKIVYGDENGEKGKMIAIPICWQCSAMSRSAEQGGRMLLKPMMIMQDVDHDDNYHDVDDDDDDDGDVDDDDDALLTSMLFRPSIFRWRESVPRGGTDFSPSLTPPEK